MKYTLGLVFQYYKMKDAGTVRIYADDMLVDEFSLTKNIGMKAVCVDKFPAYSRRITVPNRSRVLIMPDTIFLFEIAEEHLKKKITVEVENDNNKFKAAGEVRRSRAWKTIRRHLAEKATKPRRFCSKI